MYQNPYMQSLNQQSINDRIDNEIERLKQMKTQIQPVQPITQNFQLAPAHSGIKYANTIDEVKKEVVYTDTPYFSKDLSVVWIKNTKGDIRPFELKEIVQKDEKDLQIEFLQAQINEMKGMIENAKSVNEYVDDTIKDEKPTDVSIPRTGTKKSK